MRVCFLWTRESAVSCHAVRPLDKQRLRIWLHFSYRARTLVSLQRGIWNLGKQELFRSQFQAHEATHGVSRVTQAVHGHMGVGSQTPDTSPLHTMHFHAFLTSVYMYVLMSHDVCGWQRIAYGSRFLPSTMRDLGVNTRSGSGTFVHKHPTSSEPELLLAYFTLKR